MTYRFQNEDEQQEGPGNLCMALGEYNYASYNPHTIPSAPEGLRCPQTLIFALGYPVMGLRGDHRAAIENIANETDCDIAALAKYYRDNPSQQIPVCEMVRGDEVIIEQVIERRLGSLFSRREG